MNFDIAINRHSQVAAVAKLLNTHKTWLIRAGFTLTVCNNFMIELESKHYKIKCKDLCISVYHETEDSMLVEECTNYHEAITKLRSHVVCGWWYAYVGGEPIVPSSYYETYGKAKLIQLRDYLELTGFEQKYKSRDKTKWANGFMRISFYENGEVSVLNSGAVRDAIDRILNSKQPEKTQVNISINVQQQESMTLVDLVAADKLYSIGVQFTRHGTTYTYKSEVPYEPGNKVVVDSPNSGLTIVDVVSCKQGLDTPTKFASYKWVVCKVSTERYNELLEREADLVKLVKQKQRAKQLSSELANMGLTKEELTGLLGL